ncbi:hypothetical protein BGW39_011927 [Mortierella sp. 14UC]|nr:hypothetical protein BGW39_011927 [Mortierella sp. 14UC]
MSTISRRDYNILEEAFMEITSNAHELRLTHNAFILRTGIQDPWYERQFTSMATEAEKQQAHFFRQSLLMSAVKFQSHLVAFRGFNPLWLDSFVIWSNGSINN